MATMMVFGYHSRFKTIFDIILSLHSNTMSLSPFDIKGKGRINTRFFPSYRKKSVVELMYTEVTMLPLSAC